MPFEDLLKPAIRCMACAFIVKLPAPIREEVRIAIRKTIYSDKVIADGLRKIQTKDNLAPSGQTIHSHREKGHADDV
jgi:hypothetical protein